jgi:large exoprotein involved in heme utilization and adhesion
MNNREHKSSSSSSRDRCIPRRFIAYNRIKVLTFGTLGQAGLLAINAALSLKWTQQRTDIAGAVINPNLGLGQGVLASYNLFNSLNSFTYSPLQSYVKRRVRSRPR